MCCNKSKFKIWHASRKLRSTLRMLSSISHETHPLVFSIYRPPLDFSPAHDKLSACWIVQFTTSAIYLWASTSESSWSHLIVWATRANKLCWQSCFHLESLDTWGPQSQAYPHGYNHHHGKTEASRDDSQVLRRKTCSHHVGPCKRAHLIQLGDCCFQTLWPH